MEFRRMSAVLILVSALTVPAWGSIPKKKNNAPAPTYPAVDIDAGSVADSMDDRGSDAGTPAPSDSGVTAPEGPASVPAPMAETVITRPSFDPVPENQRAPIARRLTLAPLESMKRLIKRWLRANIYRPILLVRIMIIVTLQILFQSLLAHLLNGCPLPRSDSGFRRHSHA